MKWLRIVFVATLIILSLLIIYAIINCEISYKYEIENRCGDKIDILWVEEWLKETIKVWKFFLCYVIINILESSRSWVAMMPLTGCLAMASRNFLEPFSLSNEFVPFRISSRIISVRSGSLLPSALSLQNIPSALSLQNFSSSSSLISSALK